MKTITKLKFNNLQKHTLYRQGAIATTAFNKNGLAAMEKILEIGNSIANQEQHT